MSDSRDIFKVLVELVSQPFFIYSPRLKTRELESSSLPIRDEWDACIQSPENAERCIQYLYNAYPLLLKPRKVLVPGPAAAVVTEGNEIIGVATPCGDIKALSESIPISSLPPPSTSNASS